MKRNWAERLSLASRGARYQIAIATILTAVLPILVVCFIALTASYPAGTYSFAAKTVVGTLALTLAAGGYAILRKYPANIIKLRQYLLEIAEGELPDKVTLLNSEDDIKAIENYLNTILDELRGKVHQLEKQLRLTLELKNELDSQQKELLEAERHRVMIQSVGAACHHIGQPATILRAHLFCLKQKASSPEEQAWIEECTTAVDSIADVLEKLRQVSEYRTVPYRTCYESGEKGEDSVILDIEGNRRNKSFLPQ